jgi:hypothetical protein
MIVIEKGVPKPPSPQRRVLTIYPWRDLEVGDSFFSNRVPIANMKAGAHKAGKTLDMKFEVHPEGDGHRVWRVA